MRELSPDRSFGKGKAAGSIPAGSTSNPKDLVPAEPHSGECSQVRPNPRAVRLRMRSILRR